MMNQPPIGELITVYWPQAEEDELQQKTNASVAEVYYLRPEYAAAEALANIIPFERRDRTAPHVESKLDTAESTTTVHYLKPEYAPPSQEGIESTEDILTYMRDMYDFYAKQTWGFDNSDGNNLDIAKHATEARKDAVRIANHVSSVDRPEDAKLALDIFGKGEVNSKHLKSALVRIYAMRGHITEQEAIAHWQELLTEENSEITDQVRTDSGMYATFMWADKKYGNTDIAKQHILRIKRQLGRPVQESDGDTPGPRSVS